jgi:hypothetical protein
LYTERYLIPSIYFYKITLEWSEFLISTKFAYYLDLNLKYCTYLFLNYYLLNELILYFSKLGLLIINKT